MFKSDVACVFSSSSVVVVVVFFILKELAFSDSNNKTKQNTGVLRAGSGEKNVIHSKGFVIESIIDLMLILQVVSTAEAFFMLSFLCLALFPMF